MKVQGPTNHRSNLLLAAMLTSVVCLSARADDLDVYKAKIASEQKPNILFVLDYSGSMGWDTSGVDYSTNNGPIRISVLKSAITEILDSNIDNINAGLGSLYSTTTTGIRWPISELSADASTIDPAIQSGRFTVSDIIKKRINERGANGATATVDALVEAAQYFRGDPVTHNDAIHSRASRHQPSVWNTTNSQYQGGNINAAIAASYSPSNAWSSSNSGTYLCNDYSESGGPDYCEQHTVRNCKDKTDGDTTTQGYELNNNLWGDYRQCQITRYSQWETPYYNSPIIGSCEGQTNAIVLITDGVPTARNAGASLRSIVGNDISQCEDLTNTIFAGFRGTTDRGNCAIEIARSLAEETVNPYVPDSHVKTYTVGFNINGAGQQYLQRLATAGDGKFYNAQSPSELNEALSATVRELKSSSENFSELSVDIDKASFSHNDRVYYSLFTPSVKRSWQGNLKGFFVEQAGLEDINGLTAIVDGTIVDEAQSFWSDSPDGNNVKSGGASEQMLNGNRNLYTYTADTIPAAGVDLSARDNTKLRASNNDITQAMLGLSNNSSASSQRTAALDWIQNAPMGDPLHTKSVGVNYGTKQVVYIMTNQGFLHAIDATKPGEKDAGDASGGNEIFAFMPKRLLKNLPDLQTNAIGEQHIYGLDGAVTRWHDDTNSDGIVNNQESVTLYFGMRRGGSAYYAMDVSDPEAPRLKWSIDNNTTAFDRLAQTWSRMSMIRVKQGNTERRVLAFAGGYDADAQDDVDGPMESKGNAIYMVGEDGSLLWTVDKTSNPNMQYSIASDLAIIDSDNDQLADRLYVGDVGGQVWRVDFDDISQTPDVTRLADVADTSHQPFFYPPSVSLNGERGNRVLSITIGSGNRTNPLLADVQNYIYMIRDTDVEKGSPSSTFNTVTSNALYDATDNFIESTVTNEASDAQDALTAARGWKVKLAMGEKSLSSILSYEGRVMATTYTPDVVSSDDVCGVSATGTLYVMDVNDASIIDDSLSSYSGGNSSSTGTRRVGIKLSTQGIPSGAVPIMTKDSDTVQFFVDRESVDEFERTLSRVYWHAR